jgi:hypothetical protein
MHHALGATEMKGTNELFLNQATMVEAVQDWVSINFAEGREPVVKSVKLAMNKDTFIVELEGETNGEEDGK